MLSAETLLPLSNVKPRLIPMWGNPRSYNKKAVWQWRIFLFFVLLILLGVVNWGKIKLIFSVVAVR